MKVGHFLIKLNYYNLLFSDWWRLKKFKLSKNVILNRDIPYNEDNNKFHLSDYLSPFEWNGMTIFDIHGGVYYYGTKDNNKFYNAEFAKMGYKVIGLSYRLINRKNKITIKEQIDDIITAILYFYANKATYKIDFNNIIVRGDSSGGHLALMINLILNNKSLQELFGYDIPNEISPIAVEVTCPAYDYESLFNFAEEHLTKKAVEDIFSIHCWKDDFFKLYSPREYILCGYKLSPCFVITSAYDFLKKESIFLINDLIKNNYQYKLFYALPNDKKIGHIFNLLSPLSKWSKNANKEMSDYFMILYKNSSERKLD